MSGSAHLTLPSWQALQWRSMVDSLFTDAVRRPAYRRLIDEALERSGEQRWVLLMAAHVVGQADFRLHLDSHWRMLRVAWEERDSVEAAGQLLRLALTPIGHLASQLPAGNVGRATVSAFAPMTPPPDVLRWVRWAVKGG